MFLVAVFLFVDNTAEKVMNGLGWMDERCFRPLLCTVKAELGRGQPGLMR